MTVIEATSPGDAWVKVSKHLLANGVKVGNLTEELNVMTEITEFQSDDWFDSYFREIPKTFIEGSGFRGWPLQCDTPLLRTSCSI